MSQKVKRLQSWMLEMDGKYAIMSDARADKVITETAEHFYQLAEKDLGWHSVEESLPEIDQDVIVLTNDDGLLHPCPLKIGFAHLIDPDKVITIQGRPYNIASYNGWNIPGVKYWMPCPKIPEE